MFWNLSALNSLLFPPNCLVCNSPGSTLCLKCQAPWNLPITKVWFQPKILLHYHVEYGEKVNPIILAAKESNDLFAQKFLADCFVKSIKLLRTENYFEKIFMVPIPSRKSNERRRGYSHLKQILSFTQNLTLNVEVLSLLKIIKPIIDQTSLSAKARITNLQNSYSCDQKLLKKYQSKMNFSHYQIVVVDDLVTTGASVKEAIRALNVENIPVSAVICAAATLRHDRLTYEANS